LKRILRKIGYIKHLFASTNDEDKSQWNLQRIEIESRSIWFAWV